MRGNAGTPRGPPLRGQPVRRRGWGGWGAARSVYLFGARTHLPLRIVVNEAAGVFIRYTNYRPVDGILEPHRVEITNGRPGHSVAFTLATLRHNTGGTERDFAPPAQPPAGALRPR